MTDPYDDVTLTNANSITIRWNAMTGSSTGNSNILSYNLQWDAGTGTLGSTLIDSLTTSFTVNGLTVGSPYIF